VYGTEGIMRLVIIVLSLVIALTSSFADERDGSLELMVRNWQPL